MTAHGVSERRRPTGKSGWSAAAVAAAALGLLLAPDFSAAQNYPYSTGTTYGLPTPAKVTAKKADLDVVDQSAQAVVDQLKSSSPTAVDYARRASGALIFPNVESKARLLLGETNALGVLYTKDASGAWQKQGYYQGRRNGLGFGTASGSSSRIFMFMKQDSLDDFVAGEVTANYVKVDPETGETAGDADADIAAFITNVKGDESDPTFNGLWIAPVEVITE
jgi:hypothetical protein